MDFKIGVIFLFFCTGAIFGSFASCIGFRFFNDNIGFLRYYRSVCIYCKKQIPAYGLIPIISYCLILRGKCFNCKKNISLTYLFIEFFLGLIFVINYLKHDISVICVLYCALFWLLTVQSLIDIRVMMASDLLSLLIAILIIIISYYTEIDYKLILERLIYSSLFFVLSIMITKFMVSEKSVIGLGDLKIVIPISTLLSLEQFLVFVALTGFFGVAFSLFFRKNTKEFPFLPSITGAFFIAFYFVSFTINSLL